MHYLVKSRLKIQLLAIDLFASIYSLLWMVSTKAIILYLLKEAAWQYLGDIRSQLGIFLNASSDKILNLLPVAAPLIFGEV